MRMGGVIQNRYEGYASENYISGMRESQENASWFMQLSDNLVLYFLITTVLIIQLIDRNSVKSREEKNMFSFVLLFFAFVNFAKVIPTFGGRFQIVFYLFATIYIFFYSLKLQNDRINLLTLVGLFPMILFAAIRFRLGSESISAWIFMPGLGTPFLTPVLSISEIIFN